MSNIPGNIVLSAHVEMRDGRAGVFAPIGSLEAGDIIFLRQGDEERSYRVTAISTVQPDDLTPIYPSTTDLLTLITCDDYNFFQDAYSTRTVVIAERFS